MAGRFPLAVGSKANKSEPWKAGRAVGTTCACASAYGRPNAPSPVGLDGWSGWAARGGCHEEVTPPAETPSAETPANRGLGWAARGGCHEEVTPPADTPSAETPSAN